MFQTLKNAWKIADLRKKILYTLLMLLIYRVLTDPAGRRPALRGAVLFAAVSRQVHRHLLVLQALEVERDADAIGRAGTPVAIQLEAIDHGCDLRDSVRAG